MKGQNSKDAFASALNSESCPMIVLLVSEAACQSMRTAHQTENELCLEVCWAREGSHCVCSNSDIDIDD